MVVLKFKKIVDTFQKARYAVFKSTSFLIDFTDAFYFHGRFLKFKKNVATFQKARNVVFGSIFFILMTDTCLSQLLFLKIPKNRSLFIKVSKTPSKKSLFATTVFQKLKICVLSILFKLKFFLAIDLIVFPLKRAK
jgi:hypothetical protein